VSPSSEGTFPCSHRGGVVVVGAGQLAARRNSLDHVGATIWATTSRRVSDGSHRSFSIGMLSGFSSPSIGSSIASTDEEEDGHQLDDDDDDDDDDDENPENVPRFGAFRRGKTPGDLLGVGGDVSPWGESDYQVKKPRLP
jgi:hypothetical protein